jgi:hypothetical protein
MYTGIQNPVYMYIYVFFFLLQRILRIQNPVYMYIYVFSFLFPENTENTETSILLHLVKVYWFMYSQYSLETERRKHRCKSMLVSVFSVFSGNRKKKT